MQTTSSAKPHPLITNKTLAARMTQSDHDLVKFFLAIQNDDIEKALNILSKSDGKELLQPLGLLRITAFHLAAWKGRLDLMDRLFEKGANVNAPDKIGRSALFYAAHRGHVEVTRWLLERKSYTETKIGIDSCPKHSSKKTTTSKVDCRVGQDLPVPECCGRTPLHQAAKNNHARIVKILVMAGANVDAQDERGVTALLLAGCNVDRKNAVEISKFVEIIDILVSAKSLTNIVHPDTGSTALHHATTLASLAAVKRLLEGGAWPVFQCSNTKSTPLHIAAAAGNLEILLVLLSKIRHEHVDIRDKIGQTALHRACYQGHSDCAKALIDHGGNLSAETKSGITVIDVAYSHIPNPMLFLTDIMDARVKVLGSKIFSKDSQICIDFSILAPKGELQTNVIIALISAASDVEQLSILQHPLIETFLRLKWAKLRLFFFLLILLHIFFVLSLSTYALTLLRPTESTLSRTTLAISSTMLLFHNIAQVLMLPRYYIKQYETWLSLTSAIISFMVCTIVMKIRHILFAAAKINETDVQETPEWALNAISVAILFGWIQMMLLIGRFPTWGYYALMFSTVLKNVLKVLLAFVCMIIGFAFCFTILFHKNKQFQLTLNAIVKTVVMMMGEYDYEDLFPKDDKEDTMPFLTATGRVVFLGFIILASMVLMNLMIGLAVNDIQGLEKEGHIRRLLKQAEFVAHLEKLTSNDIFHSEWLHPWLRKLVHSKRVVATRMLLHYRDNHHNKASRGISSELMESLYLLASKNCQRDDGKRYGAGPYHSDANVTTLLINLEEQIEQLRRFHYPYLERRSTVFGKRLGHGRRFTNA